MSEFDKRIEDQVYEWYKTTGQYLDPDEFRETVETSYKAGAKQGRLNTLDEFRSRLEPKTDWSRNEIMSEIDSKLKKLKE